MKMKNSFAMMLFLVVSVMIDALKPIVLFALVGGPFRDFKWGGLPLRPTKDSGAEFEEGGFSFEKSASPNGDSYSTGTAVIGYVQQECAFTAAEFKAFKAMQDGDNRSGVATMPNGDVLSINASIEGEHVLSDGKCTVKLAGKIKLQ
jgi:hypothetical protein